MYSSNQMPKVSVTVVTYNHGEWLRECLDSIITQETNFSFEVIVSDDASTDGTTRAILAEYAERYPDVIKPVFHETNIGGTKNYLDTMSRARGTYIAHIDGDDVMLPQKLQKQADFLDMHPECSMVVHPVIRINANGIEVSRDRNRAGSYKISNLNHLVETANFVVHSSKMYRASAIITRTADKRLRDFYFNVEHASKGHVGVLNEYLGKYRVSVGVTSTEGLMPRWKLNDSVFRYAEALGAKSSAVRKGRLVEKKALIIQGIKTNNVEAAELLNIGLRDWFAAPWKLQIMSLVGVLIGPIRTIKLISIIYSAARCQRKRFGLATPSGK